VGGSTAGAAAGHLVGTMAARCRVGTGAVQLVGAAAVRRRVGTGGRLLGLVVLVGLNAACSQSISLSVRDG